LIPNNYFLVCLGLFIEERPQKGSSLLLPHHIVEWKNFSRYMLWWLFIVNEIQIHDTYN